MATAYPIYLPGVPGCGNSDECHNDNNSSSPGIHMTTNNSPNLSLNIRTVLCEDQWARGSKGPAAPNECASAPPLVFYPRPLGMAHSEIVVWGMLSNNRDCWLSRKLAHCQPAFASGYANKRAGKRFSRQNSVSI